MEKKRILMMGQSVKWNGKEYTISDTTNSHPSVKHKGKCVRLMVDGKSVWVHESAIDVIA